MDFDSWKAKRDGKDRWLQDYTPKPTINGVHRIPLKTFNEDGGKFIELQRLIGGYIKDGDLDIKVSQISYTEVLPGAVKAFHIHKKQFDVWFVPPSSRLLIGLFSPMNPEINMRFVLGDGQPELLIIPPEIAHGCANPYTERSALFYMTSEVFTDGEDCDEWRMTWDYLGEDFWEIKKG
jgi:dTDP-4-dehydrorhamnose 3,5-epimerase-like enzyme